VEDYIYVVQRLFSMFPHGGPGFALLLLRISVAVVFLVNTAHLAGLPLIPWLFAVGLLISISLSIGFLTPILSVVAGVTLIAQMLIDPHGNSLLCIPAMLNTASLALLGPGAYSLDARLFGRRVMVIPSRKNSNYP